MAPKQIAWFYFRKHHSMWVTLRQLICLCHTLVTLKLDIAYSVYIAQMFLIHCQLAVALQVNYN